MSFTVQFQSPGPFRTESGFIFPKLEIAYWTAGKINADASNVVWVCHALTANADASDWWYGLVGPGKAIDPARYFIVCANMIGSCYGSTSPQSLDPGTGRPYGLDFPLITIGDQVSSLILLAEHLGIGRIALGLGGSMGGQQVLEWAVREPDRFECIIPMACNARHSPWGIAFNQAQRMALAADPGFATEGLGQQGLEAARAIAMISYRNAPAFNMTQQDPHDGPDTFLAASYLQHQGRKLSARFTAWSYWVLGRCMDSHHVGRGRGGVENALAQIRARTYVVGIPSDILFPIWEQELLAAHIPGAQLRIMDSAYGHDGFLIEYAYLDRLLREIMG